MTTSHKKLNLEAKLKERNKLYKEQLAQKTQKEKLIQEKAPLMEEGQKIAAKLDETMNITAYFSSKLQEKEDGISLLFNRLHKKLQKDGNAIKHVLNDYKNHLSITEKELLTEIKDIMPALDDNKAHIDEIKSELDLINQQEQTNLEASNKYSKGKTKNVLFEWELTNNLDVEAVKCKLADLGRLQVTFQLKQIEAYGWWVLKDIDYDPIHQLGGLSIGASIDSKPSSSEGTLTTKVTISVIISANGVTKTLGGGSFKHFKKSLGEKSSVSSGTGGANGTTSTNISKENNSNKEWANGKSYNWSTSQAISKSFITRVFEYNFISSENRFEVKKLGGVKGSSFSDLSNDESFNKITDVPYLPNKLNDKTYISIQ